MSDRTQKDVVFNIVRLHQPVRTEQVKILAMQAGCSCADRYLRWLQEDGLIFSRKRPENRTKTWHAVPQAVPDKRGQLVFQGQGVST